MAVYNTDLSRSTGVVVGAGIARTKFSAVAIVALTTAMIDNADDDVGLFYLPKGAVVCGGQASCSDIDTNASPAVVIDIGDADDEDRLFAALTIGQAGTLSNALAPTGHLYKYTTQTQIRAYIKTAAATGAAGTLKVEVEYFIDEGFGTTALVAA